MSVLSAAAAEASVPFARLADFFFPPACVGRVYFFAAGAQFQSDGRLGRGGAGFGRARAVRLLAKILNCFF